MASEFCNFLIDNDELNAEKIFEGFSKELGVIESLIVPAMVEIGELWEKNEISLSQIYLSSKIVERLVDKILPDESPERKYQPKIAIAALEDYHLMGKNIVASIIKASGYCIKDFGRVTVEELLNFLIENEVDILLISTLMLPSALNVKEITNFIKTRGLAINVVVGGAPFNFNSKLADEVGANFYCKRASDIIDIIDNIKVYMHDIDGKSFNCLIS